MGGAQEALKGWWMRQVPEATETATQLLKLSKDLQKSVEQVTSLPAHTHLPTSWREPSQTRPRILEQWLELEWAENWPAEL